MTMARIETPERNYIMQWPRIISIIKTGAADRRGIVYCRPILCSCSWPLSLGAGTTNPSVSVGFAFYERVIWIGHQNRALQWTWSVPLITTGTAMVKKFHHIKHSPRTANAIVLLLGDVFAQSLNNWPGSLCWRRRDLVLNTCMMRSTIPWPVGPVLSRPGPSTSRFRVGLSCKAFRGHTAAWEVDFKTLIEREGEKEAVWGIRLNGRMLLQYIDIWCTWHGQRDQAATSAPSASHKNRLHKADCQPPREQTYYPGSHYIRFWPERWFTWSFVLSHMNWDERNGRGVC